MTYSRFHLCDLQIHTPADARQGYGDVGGRDPNPAFARRLVDAHAKAGVRVMAVSDHNRVDWYPVLRDAGDELGVFVFPALEFSVNRCHLWTVPESLWERRREPLIRHRFTLLLANGSHEDQASRRRHGTGPLKSCERDRS
jgi:hypothetical protein